ncbi:MAG TPA: 2-C-methyl-D-erythritol 4-phosphate cytidylyltransferase [Ktedonobacterales bacterium]|jgi:2-C-methyl-D-erythritol 4-phosphate cytidylyltransferase
MSSERGRASAHRQRRKRVAAVIVAAGSSQRMQGINKTWASLGGKPLLAHSIAVFEQSGLIDDLVVVLAKEALIEGKRRREQEGWGAMCCFTPGGARRRDSALAGLEALAPAPDYVLIHDGARPFITTTLIEQGLAAARRHGAATAAVPVKDTIKRVGPDGLVLETLDRAALWSIQTPQVFAYDLILAAHHTIEPAWDATDDAALVERAGHPVALFMGAYENIKITTPDDLLIAEAMLNRLAKSSALSG